MGAGFIRLGDGRAEQRLWLRSHDAFVFDTLCPKDVRLCRLMCGRPLALRQGFLLIWATPNSLGRSPEFIVKRNGSAKRFRTSGGRAARRESLLGEAFAMNTSAPVSSRFIFVFSPRTMNISPITFEGRSE